MHFGKRIQKMDYYQNCERMQLSEVQWNLVVVHGLPNVSSQIQRVVTKANDMLAFIAEG